MVEIWRLMHGDATSGAAARRTLETRIASQEFETWFESDRGRLLAIVTNGERALVMVLREVGDAGEHVVDPQAGDGEQAGYVLSNGQGDVYRDADTVPLPLALDVIEAVIDGRSAPGAVWSSDR